MKKYFKTIIFFLLIYGPTFSQTCEKYNRKLFHSLPDTFPQRINCVDKFGKKQGWWIIYKVEYNPVDKPDELAKGDYVDNYTYGKYKDNTKIGTWYTVQNVHLIYESQADTYYYSKDTSKMTSWIGAMNFEVIYTKDSMLVSSKTFYSKDNYLVCIECDRKKNENCQIIYNKKVVKTFPYSNFNKELEKTFCPSCFLKDNIEQK